MKKRAFTLLEMMFASALMLLMLGLVAVNLKGHTPKYSSRSLAEVLLKEVQAARMQAIASHSYVVLGFPHSGGDLPSQSYELLQGPSRARLQRQVRIDSEHPGGQVFLGTWPVASGTFSFDPPALGREPAGFSWTDWFAPNPVPAEHFLGFTPSGTVVSSNLPLLDGAYHLVVGSAMQTGAGPVLTAVADPFTLAISPRGDSQLISGLIRPAAGVALVQGSDSSRSSPVRPWWGGGANQIPTVELVQLGPKAASPPPNVESLVAPGGFTTLTVEASDPDGDPLDCAWTCNGGSLCSQGAQAMDYDPLTQRWRSVQVFTPDPNDAAGHIYELQCSVTDARGAQGVAASGVQLNQQLEMRKENRVVYMRIPYGDLYESGSDGSDLVTVPTAGRQADYPWLAPDGSRVIYTAQVGGGYHIFSMNRDGSDVQQLTNQGLCYGASFSADGSKIVFCSTRSGPARLYLMAACGEVSPSPDAPPVTMLAPTMVCCWNQPNFNSLGTKVCFAGYPTGATQSAGYVVDLASGAVTQVTPTVAHRAGQDTYHQLQYCQLGGQEDLISGSMAVNNLPGADSNLFLTREAGLAQFRTLSSPGGETSCEHISFLRDGTGIVYVGDAISRCDFNFTNWATGPSKPIVTGLNLNNPSCW